MGNCWTNCCFRNYFSLLKFFAAFGIGEGEFKDIFTWLDSGDFGLILIIILFVLMFSYISKDDETDNTGGDGITINNGGNN